MTDDNIAVWNVHSRTTDDGDSVFLDGQCVAIGWSGMGDLSKIPADRRAFKDRLVETHPHITTGALPALSGVIFRFVYAMKEGDLVTYRSTRDRLIHIGIVIGPYRYEQTWITTQPVDYANRRRVKWLASVQPSAFTKDALNRSVRG